MSFCGDIELTQGSVFLRLSLQIFIAVKNCSNRKLNVIAVVFDVA